jgi:hypothetical protein
MQLNRCEQVRTRRFCVQPVNQLINESVNHLTFISM